MPPTLPSQRELVATDSSAVEDHTNELISSNYIDSDPILFSQKHLNNLIRDLCISKEKGSSLHHWNDRRSRRVFLCFYSAIF